MADVNISGTQISNLSSTVTDFSVDPKSPDSVQDQEETTHEITKWRQWFGYYKQIPELKKAIDAFATWVVGKGYTSDPDSTVQLENMRGWGEDTFNSIMFNMIITKKIAGDAFAEIIRDPDSGLAINLKPLDPGKIKIIVGRNGLVKRYEYFRAASKNGWEKFKPQEILHLCNDRVADEIHGTSVVEACEDVILMRNEAMKDYRTVLHRNINPLKIVQLDTDNEQRINEFITKWQNMTKDKEVIFVPKGNVEVEIPPTTLQDPLPWIKYLENFFYQAVGIPKIILGGSEEFTEASSKIAYLTFEQVYAREQKELSADLWNQLAIRVEFDTPASLKNELLQSEKKNTGQTGFQQNDFAASVAEE